MIENLIIIFLLKELIMSEQDNWLNMRKCSHAALENMCILSHFICNQSSIEYLVLYSESKKKNCDVDNNFLAECYCFFYANECASSLYREEKAATICYLKKCISTSPKKNSNMALDFLMVANWLQCYLYV